MEVLNFIIVTLYGNILMFLFTKEEKSRRQTFGIIALYAACGLLNLVLNRFASSELLYMLYPATVHLPLLLYYIFVIKTPPSEAVFALTCAYMLTTPRKWICVLLVHLFGGGTAVSVLFETVVSAALLLLCARFIAPVVTKIFSSGKREAKYLCLLPATMYVITYATTVYSDFLQRFPAVTIPTLTTALSVFFIVFEVYFFSYVSDKAETRRSRELLDLQLRSVERLAEYMGSSEMYFCENKTVNAFLSMYKAAAKEHGVFLACSCNLSENIRTFDFLVVLTGILDDALCTAKEYIKLEAVAKNSQICVMAETDGAGVYNGTTLATLQSFVHKNRGFISTGEKNYKIQISFQMV